MKNRFILVGMFCCISFISSFAQETSVSITSQGYIILTNNDTLRGDLKERNPDQKISVRPPGQTEYKEFGVDEVRSIWYKSDYYYKPVQLSADPKKEKRFLLCLAEGSIDLYKFKDIFYVKNG